MYMLRLMPSKNGSLVLLKSCKVHVEADHGSKWDKVLANVYSKALVILLCFHSYVTKLEF